jgi:quercetin dioxygenase-like cupin family protein
LRELFSGVTAQTFWGDKMMLSRVVLEPGGVVPPHQHPHEQAGVVLEGTLEFTIGGETKVLGPGEMYIIPGNVEHKVVPVGDQTAVALDIFSPVREEYK